MKAIQKAKHLSILKEPSNHEKVEMILDEVSFWSVISMLIMVAVDSVVINLLKYPVELDMNRFAKIEEDSIDQNELTPQRQRKPTRRNRSRQNLSRKSSRLSGLTCST